MTSRSMPLGAIAVAFSLATIPAAAGNPSFDCDGVRHPVEVLICSDDELAALDIAVARAYAGALARAKASDVGPLRSDQKAWRKALMRCGNQADERACALSGYQVRLKEIGGG
jgi:uncharacterized protein